jgi:hypothetical protein
MMGWAFIYPRRRNGTCTTECQKDDPVPVTTATRIRPGIDHDDQSVNEDMGVETLMWGSDHPHRDALWRDSPNYIAKQFGHPPAHVPHKITCENAGKLYALIN